MKLASIATLAVVAGLYGCATTDSEQAGTTPGATSSSSTSSSSTSGTARAPVDKGAGMSGTAGAGRPDLKRSVFYEFDRYEVKAEYRSLVESHAAWLRANPKARLTIEGNADERGSREYNVALGQKRAESVTKMMVLMGAKPEQIEAVSWGKEKPRNTGHDEAAWAENRRSDFAAR